MGFLTQHWRNKASKVSLGPTYALGSTVFRFRGTRVFPGATSARGGFRKEHPRWARREAGEQLPKEGEDRGVGPRVVGPPACWNGCRGSACGRGPSAAEKPEQLADAERQVLDGWRSLSVSGMCLVHLPARSSPNHRRGGEIFEFVCSEHPVCEDFILMSMRALCSLVGAVHLPKPRAPPTV